METQTATLDDLRESGRNLVFDDPKTISLFLDADDSIPPHEHPGETILFHVLDGEISLTLGDDTLALSAGQVVRFSGDQDISPAADTDAHALLVFVPQE